MAKGKRGGKRGIGTPVKRLRNYKNAVVPRAKLMNYLLNPKKSNGKSVLFNAIGYNMSNHRRLSKDIKAGLKNNIALKFKKNSHGEIEYQVDMVLGITKKVRITTAWAIKKGGSPRFVTAYKAKG